MSFYINGVYDFRTLDTLKTMGIKKIGFDLRPLSTNLITFTELKKILPLANDFETSLIFGTDTVTTVESFLDLIGEHRTQITLQFREHRPAFVYQSFSCPFEWMFHPDGDWRQIFSLENLKGVLLPIEWKDYYQNKPSFWHLLEERKIPIHIYASTLKQAQSIEFDQNLSVALDLAGDFLSSYRVINFENLRKINDWKRINENLTGQ